MAILPTKILEIEFDAGIWTDVTADLVELETRRGRNRESGAFETGTINFTLRNDGRKYDPDHTTGPYYGKLRPNRRVRFRATYSAVTYPLFQGYIDSIDQVYGGPNDAAAAFQASDIFKLLNRVDLPAGVYAAEVLADSPSHWWRLGEPAGSTVVVDQIGGAPGTAFGGVTFGTQGAPVRDGDTAATFDAIDDYVSFGTAPLITGFPYSIEIWLRTATRTLPGNEYFFTQAPDNAVGGSGQPAGFVTGTDAGSPGRVTWDGCNSGAVRVDDNAWHHVVLTATSSAAGAQTLYIDGVNVATGTATVPGTGTSLDVRIGYPASAPFVAVSRQSWLGDLDELAMYPAALGSARVAAHNTGGRTPWNGDLPGARLGRILDLAAVPTGDRTIDTGQATLQSTSLATTALAYAQKVEETDLGELFVTGDGKVRFLDRQSAVTGAYLTSKATLVDDDSGAGIPYRSVSADVDEARVVTRATVSRDGSTAVTYYDAAAKAEFGWLDETHDGLLHDSDAYSASYAQWIVSTHKTPSSRVGTVALELTANPATMYPAILALELGDRVTYKRKPQNVGAVISIDMRVEAITHETGAGYWRTSLQLSPFNLAGGQPVGVWDVTLWDQCVWGI